MEEKINKLHNRHLAKLLAQLNEINTSSIIIDTIKRHLSFYTNDIKKQVLTSNQSYSYDRNKKN